MKSQTLQSFWDAYRLWKDNPFHPSLRFKCIIKCINSEEDIWSVRVNHSYRAIGILNDSTVTWFLVLDWRL